MKEVRMSHVLVSPLNWGLGHATRDIPVIRSLFEYGHDITIAACGNALVAMRQEFPAASFIEFRDYPAPYSSGKLFLPKLAAAFPFLLRSIAEERRTLAQILAKNRYDLIISDNRLGVYSDKVPSVFITHQLHFHLPLFAYPTELLALPANEYLLEKFNRVVVPDNPPGPTALAGKLSRPFSKEIRKRIYFTGILSSIKKTGVSEDLDQLVIISGPEPQRTRLEEILLGQVASLPGETMVLLGSPGTDECWNLTDTCTVTRYAATEEKRDLMNRAKCVICRSGYTSMMELAELDKRCATFIPTPGQTEQEYLSWYYEQNRWFLSQSQYQLDLGSAFRHLHEFSGFPSMPKTDENVKNLCRNVFEEYLD